MLEQSVFHLHVFALLKYIQVLCDYHNSFLQTQRFKQYVFNMF